ncbi:hypothetical protein Sfum_4002 [Syntrophobacter fumaroxidans MPOB]|uniref:Uncharacterized protein n=1 Tax=Syntrophobacter fumaroxidans (strain DSM 10017 / MPOB) TaxID=335543 RepID=A0LQG6_SYNFM|nr:hypothetical protein Sfum_4002 [Syntrophobacter fumaroxidans MPOB]
MALVAVRVRAPPRAPVYRDLDFLIVREGPFYPAIIPLFEMTGSIHRGMIELRGMAQRAGFTPSERVAIKKAIVDAVEERRGNPNLKSNPVKCPELEKGEETRSIAAKRAGFTSEMTSRRAERVVNRGIPELVGLRGYP